MTDIGEFQKVFDDLGGRIAHNRAIGSALERLERIERSSADFAEKPETFRLPYTSSVPQPTQQWR